MSDIMNSNHIVRTVEGKFAAALGAYPVGTYESYEDAAFALQLFRASVELCGEMSESAVRMGRKLFKERMHHRARTQRKQFLIDLLAKGIITEEQAEEGRMIA